MGAIAGFALTGLSMVMQGAAESQGLQHEGAKADRAQKIAHVQADQIDASYKADFNNFVSNVRAIRAATGAHPDSPSVGAYIDSQEKVSERSRRIRSGGVRMQATQYGDDARFYRSAASSALFGGFAKAGAHFATPPIGMFA